MEYDPAPERRTPQAESVSCADAEDKGCIIAARKPAPFPSSSLRSSPVVVPAHSRISGNPIFCFLSSLNPRLRGDERILYPRATSSLVITNLSLSFVITGLVPVMTINLAPCSPYRDGRDKPGHDIQKIDARHHPCYLGRGRAVVSFIPSPSKEGVRNAGCSTHTQPRVQK
jgi:hypothetical protein